MVKLQMLFVNKFWLHLNYNKITHDILYLAGFYPSTFLYSHFFPKIGFPLLFAESVGHQGGNFFNLDPQIIGKCISDTLFDFKSQCLSLRNIISPANIMVW